MTEASLVAVKAHATERLLEHRANLAGWSEGRYCEACKGIGHRPSAERPSFVYTCLACQGKKVLDVGYLVPTEPDPDERTAVRRELQAAIAELELVLAVLKG